MRQFSEEELREVIAVYEATRAAALMQRDERLRTFHAAGWRPVDLQRITGYSRETIRQALRPEVRQATNRSRRRRYGFALAGGYVVQAAGLLERPSDDADLFTAWDHLARRRPGRSGPATFRMR